MVLGGLLWVFMYGTEILLGLKTGETYGDPSESVLAWLGGASFSGAIFCAGIGFVGLYARLQGRSRKLGIAGLLLESVAIIAAAVNLSLLLLSGVTGAVTEFEPLGLLGVVGTFVGGCLLLGIAALRADVLPRWAGVLLLTVGVLFWLLIVATIPLEAVLPSYVIEDLPFPIAGAALVLVGRALSRFGTSSGPTRPGRGAQAGV
jgi:hypothetical protein